ncbi:DUF2303 family protein [Acidiphilium angustum]|uniref:DUF2303 family protein n=1 Tax=Acidiphilium angustum TaxID=523 RepID=UPI000493E332|nr:DUF2303 family protein [Acidiphilium angustum]
MSDLTAAAIKEIVDLAHAPHRVGFSALPGQPGIITQVVKDGFRAEDVTSAVLSRAPMPPRRVGTVTLQTTGSFIDFGRRMREEDRSLHFADRQKRTITTIFNYHDPVRTALLEGESGNAPVKEVGTAENPEACAQWGDFRSTFAFPFSRQWKTWNEVHRKKLSQLDLATFLEDNIRDIRHESQSELPPHLRQIVESLRLVVGTPQRLLEVARGFTLNAEEVIRSVINTSTGETQIVYEQNHKVPGKNAATLDVPTAFTIGIPVFDGDAPYHLLCRLRHSKAGTAVNWMIDVQALPDALEDAFVQAVEIIKTNTGIPLVYGEAPVKCPV